MTAKHQTGLLHTVATTLLVAMLLSACGSRRSEEDVATAMARLASPRLDTPAVTSAGPLDPSGAPVEAESGSVSPSEADAERATTSIPLSGGKAAGIPAPVTAGPRAEPGQPAAPVATRPGSPKASEPTSSGTGPQAKKATIKIGAVGIYSGIPGATFKSILDGVKVWIRTVNAHGGVTGHPVELIAMDSGGDTARHRAAVQKLVEVDKVIAFVGNTEVLSGGSTVEYHERVRVPVIGSDTGSPHYYRSRMHFPEAANSDAKYATEIAVLAVAAKSLGLSTVATITCTEAQSCADADRVYSEQAEKVGLKIVYRARASIAQPDFTTECLQAKSAGAKMVLQLLDGQSMSRFALACARQAYHPLLASGQGYEFMAKDPNLEGVVAATGVFPWFLANTPARAEFHQAMATYAAGLTVESMTALGWTAAKIFERAAQSLSEPPSAESILAGLWSIRDEDFGGLTYRLTYNKDKAAVPVACGFYAQVSGGRWTSPDQGALHCSDWKPR